MLRCSVILIFQTVQFCLVGSKAEGDFLARLFGFALLPVVSFPLDLFVSGGKIIVIKEIRNKNLYFFCSNTEIFVTIKLLKKK